MFLLPMVMLGCVPRDPVTVIFTRHAEKSKDGTGDPPLSPAGEERARCLADVLASARPTRLFTTEYKRTQATLAPLAERSGLIPTVIPAAEPDRWRDTLKALQPGSTAVVVGHSNTVPGLVAALGGTLVQLDNDGNFPETDYDRLVLVTLQGGKVTTATTLHTCVRAPDPSR